MKKIMKGGQTLELRVERMESVIAPSGVWKAVCDFFRGLVDGFLS